MSGPKTRTRRVSRTARPGAARLRALAPVIALAFILPLTGCEDSAAPDPELEARQDQLAASAFSQFLRPPETPTDACTVTLSAGGGLAGDAAMIQDAIDAASPFDIICLTPGTYALTATLTVDSVDSITLRGLGDAPSDVELDWSLSVDTGVAVSAPGFWLENVWVHDPLVTGVVVTSSNASDNPSVMRKIKVSWGADASVDTNGPAGVAIRAGSYVIVEFSEFIGAILAGIQVTAGSSDVILRNNFSHANHLGIALTNSVDIELVSNDLSDNTGGLFVSNEPPASPTDPVLATEGVLVFKNEIRDNNRASFTDPSVGLPSMVPVGSGTVVIASTNNELRENWITGNVTTGVLYLTYFTASALSTGVWPLEADLPADYDPYPTNNFINDNIFEFDEDNDFFQEPAYNGLPVDPGFRFVWNLLNLVPDWPTAGTPKPFNPVPPCMANDLEVDTAFQPPYPDCPSNQANDPATNVNPGIIETLDRPVLMDGTLLDFDDIENTAPALCFGTASTPPTTWIGLDSPRRGYPISDTDPGRQAEFDCDLAELPSISFP